MAAELLSLAKVLVCVCVCVCVCVHVCMCACVYAIYLFVCGCMCVCVFEDICVYCIRTHASAHTEQTRERVYVGSGERDHEMSRI
jgi:xanthine/uracil permease